tara:strand:+ start:494 stop:901 length:408 start_codon:yes stop_codon:yes gene_type:complete
MTKLNIDFPKNSKGLLKSVGRAFIGLVVIILASIIWEAIRDQCNLLSNQSVISWIQLLISWILLSFCLAIVVPNGIMKMLLISLVVGLLVTAVRITCNGTAKIGDYLLDILQGVTTTMAAGASIYGLSKALKWYD